jgi:hypothetical protein
MAPSAAVSSRRGAVEEAVCRSGRPPAHRRPSLKGWIGSSRGSARRQPRRRAAALGRGGRGRPRLPASTKIGGKLNSSSNTALLLWGRGASAASAAPSARRHVAIRGRSRHRRSTGIAAMRRARSQSGRTGRAMARSSPGTEPDGSSDRRANRAEQQHRISGVGRALQRPPPRLVVAAREFHPASGDGDA